MFIDWNWIFSRGVWRWEKKDKHWNGADHRAPGSVPGWAHHWTGCPYCCVHHEDTKRVSRRVKMLGKDLFYFYYSLFYFRLTNFKDRIVVMSIHQPRYSIFKLFDTLTLLSRGNCVYHGPSTSSLNYFKSLGKSWIYLNHHKHHSWSYFCWI